MAKCTASPNNVGSNKLFPISKNPILSKRGEVQNLGIALGLALKQRLWQTRKWSIAFVCTALPTLSYNDQHSRAKNTGTCCVRLHVESDNVMNNFHQMATQWARKCKQANRNLFVFVFVVVVVVVVMVLFCFFACIFFAGNVQEKKKKRSYHANFTKKKYAK